MLEKVAGAYARFYCMQLAKVPKLVTKWSRKEGK